MTSSALPFREIRSRFVRPEGPLFGALRAVRLALETAHGMVRVQLAHVNGGEAAARETFADVAERLADVFGVRVELRGTLSGEAHEIRVANHTSYLDILVLSAARGGRFLSRHDVEGWMIVGRVASQIGCLFVDRDSHSARAGALRKLGRAASDGAPLLVFPEGKTSGGELHPFQRGAFAVARSAGVPVRPLAILYDDVDEVAWVGDATLLPHVWKRLCGGYVRAEVLPLEVLHAEGRTAAALSDAARDAIAAALGRRVG